MSQNNGREQQNPQSATASKSQTMNVTATATPTATETVAATATPTPAAPAAPQAEEVWIVRFHEKAHPNDPNDVVLCVNGERHQQMRGEEGPCPQRFLDVADRATYPHYQQKPGKALKVAAYIRRFPYDKLRKSTMKEYMEFRAKGTRENADYLEKNGMEPPSKG